MSLLATAGIYLVLDVNSPLPNQHLNRYEPWTTYNEAYLSHVFSVINEFSGYNNTLAFFAGNEIVNDELSATNSPAYIKAVVRDIKQFMKTHNERWVPIGYSAADDLAYRISLAQYLECYERDPFETVDFYGVNSYQWCGEQSFQSSGYNILVKDYSSYSKPIFFSEYGCNEVTPRKFKEIGAIYSPQMTNVFSGGLVYEFAQEENNYGLVDYADSGDVNLLPDYYSFKEQIANVKEIQISNGLVAIEKTNQFKKGSNEERKVLCKGEYLNLDVSKGVPSSISKNMIKVFKSKKKGELVTLTSDDLSSSFKIFGIRGEIIQNNPTVYVVSEINTVKTKYKNACLSLHPSLTN